MPVRRRVEDVWDGNLFWRGLLLGLLAAGVLWCLLLLLGYLVLVR
jgi:hypothetical protein